MSMEDGTQDNHGGVVAKLWHEYQVRAYGHVLENASPKQRELKLCFFAAIYEFMEYLDDPATMTPGPDENQADLELMAGIHNELTTFFFEQERLAGVRR